MSTYKTTIGLTLFALVVSLSGNAADKKVESVPLVGSNPKGDVVRWQDASVWRDVTVTRFEIPAAGGALLAITNVPSGFQAGVFTNFVSVALRGEGSPPPVTNAIAANQIYDGHESPRNSLPAVKAEYQDMYAWSKRTDFQPRYAQPEFLGTVIRDRDQKTMMARFYVTITHLSVERSQVYCLVRRTKPNGTLIEGWYTDVEYAAFRREAVK